MAEYLQAPPRRKALGLLADALTSGQEALNTVNLPYVGGLGGLLFGQAPQYLQDVSYGMPAFRGGNVATGGLGTLTPDTRMLDVATLPFVGAGAAKAGQVGAKTLGKEVARQVETGTGLIGSNVLDPRQYMFIGEKSKAWDTASNKVAKALEKEGVAPETIWSQTGNVKAPDGKWRQEISDVGVTANEMQKAQVYNLGNVLQHEDLFKAYPNLLNTQVKLKGQQNSDSWYSPLGFSGKLSGNTIPFDAIQIGQYENTKELPSFVRQQLFNNEVEKINNQIKDITEEKIVSGKTRYVIKEGMQDKANELNKQFDILKKQFSTKKDALYNPDVSSTLHEVQHNIQQIENFAKGGTPAQSQKSIDNYKRLLGEAEARLTENRIPLTQEQRLQYYPYAQGQYGLDVPYGELIVQGLLK